MGDRRDRTDVKLRRHEAGRDRPLASVFYDAFPEEKRVRAKTRSRATMPNGCHKRPAVFSEWLPQGARQAKPCQLRRHVRLSRLNGLVLLCIQRTVERIRRADLGSSVGDSLA